MPRKHTVAAGDCIASIAFTNGLAPDTLWDHPMNAELKKLRGDLYQLRAGDVVHVPDVRPRSVKLATDRVHTVRRRAVPEVLKMRLLDEDEPRRNLSYEIEIEGVRTAARSDGEGWIEHRLLPDVKRVTLFIGANEVMELDVGALPPLDQPEGVVARLRNLGYLGPEEPNPHELSNAIGDLQKHNQLEVTGVLDDTTRARLGALHGS